MTSKIVAGSERKTKKNTNPAYPKGGGWWTFPRIIWELGTVVWALIFAPPEKGIAKKGIAEKGDVHPTLENFTKSQAEE
jgi:hypothetical protein